MNDENTIRVTTWFNSDLIKQEVAGGPFDIHEQFVERILNLQEQGVREALIKLGWTPPLDQ